MVDFLDGASISRDDCFEKRDLIDRVLEQKSKLLAHAILSEETLGFSLQNSSKIIQENQRQEHKINLNEDPPHLLEETKRRILDEARGNGVDMKFDLAKDWEETLKYGGYTYLHMATFAIASEAAQYYLDHPERVTHVDAESELGATALHTAFSHLTQSHPKTQSLVATLLDHEASPVCMDKGSNTPLIYCAQFGDAQV